MKERCVRASLGALLALLCSTTSCSLTLPPEPDEPPTYGPETIVVTTAMDGPQRVQLRWSRAEVSLHCDAMDSYGLSDVAPVVLADELYEPARELAVTPDRPIVLRRRPNRPCDLLRIDHPSGARAVLRIDDRHGPAQLELGADGFEGYNYRGWTQQPGCSPPPPPTECAGERLAQPGLDWSEPVPVGRGLTISSLEHDGDCLRLEFESADWHDEGTSFAWRVCTGPLALPIAEGDVLDIAAPGERGDTLRLERVRTAAALATADTSPAVRHQPPASSRLIAWLSRSGTVLTSSNNNVGGLPHIRATRTNAYCACSAPAGCATLRMPVQIQLRIDHRQLVLGSGERVTVARPGGGTIDLAVLQAAHRPIIDPQCSPGRAARHDDFEVVLLERLPAEEHKLIVADGPATAERAAQ